LKIFKSRFKNFQVKKFEKTSVLNIKKIIRKKRKKRKKNQKTEKRVWGGAAS
jgi:hypothetical protein